jgi:hypothetical protein
MKVSHVLPLAALSTAFVLPPQDVVTEVAFEDKHRADGWYESAVEENNEISASFKKQYEEVTDTVSQTWGQFTER